VAQRDFPAFLRDKATSISLAAGRDIAGEARFTLLEKVLIRLRDELESPHSDGVAWRGRIEARLYKKGELVRFAEGAAESNSIVEGRLMGIGPGGELLIAPQGENGTRSFLAGELLVY
jgi:hypothetical protein